MPLPLEMRTLTSLRSTRDLRAEILDLAATLAVQDRSGVLTVAAPLVSVDTVRGEWERSLRALDPELASRLTLKLVAPPPTRTPVSDTALLLQRPNYRFEVLRLLLRALISGVPALNVATLCQAIGASQTPIRAALGHLEEAGLSNRQRGRITLVDPRQLTIEQLIRIGARPQQVHFGFARGAGIKSPATLSERWQALATHGQPPLGTLLSGAPAAQFDTPHMDLAGVPRLDLMVAVHGKQVSLDTSGIRQLDDGLEQERGIPATAPVVLTVVRAREDTLFPSDDARDAKLATHADIFLSLLDLGFNAQARQYLREVSR